MALATICPHCNTTFRVASDQLKLRGGIVRCGACNNVFDGNVALADLGAAVARPAGATAVPAILASAPPATPASDAADVAKAPAQQEPIRALNFDTAVDPFDIPPTSPQRVPAPEPAPEPAPLRIGPDPVRGQPVDAAPQIGPDPVLGQQGDEEILALPMLDDDIAAAGEAPAPPPGHEGSGEFQLPLLVRASASAAPAPACMPQPPVDAAASAHPTAARRTAAEPQVAAPVAAVTAGAIEPWAEPGEHEPEFVKTGRRKERGERRRRLVLGAACVLLTLALAAQGVVMFRNVLAARYPQARALLAGACAVFGCKVELPAQIDVLSVETGELQSLDANTYSFTTLLRNQASLVQTWPHLELALTDANDKPLVRRVFTPAEYLPPGVAPAKGIAPRSEQAVKLYFALNQVKPSGYHIAIFYP